MDKTLILKSIQKYLGFDKDKDFAEYLEIAQSTLSSWYSRGSIDYCRIIAKCKDIDANWLLTGQGEMLKFDPKKQLNQVNEQNELYGLNQTEFIDNVKKSLIVKDELISSYIKKIELLESNKFINDFDSRLKELETFKDTIILKLKLDLEIESLELDLKSEKSSKSVARKSH